MGLLRRFNPRNDMNMIYLGADHAGWHLKEEIKKYLEELGYEYEDLGNQELDLQDDYPDFALAVAEKVVETGEKGILICATGLGMAMVANKVKGIRAAVCWDDFTALQSREHNDANILCLGGKVIDLETAKKIIRIWLETEFSGEERHVRRLKKIKRIEEEQGSEGNF
jgi:ribose 5-phosphate isomerase B